MVTTGKKKSFLNSDGKICFVDTILDNINLHLSNNEKIGFIYFDIVNSTKIKLKCGEEVYREILNSTGRVLNELYHKSILMKEDIIAKDRYSEDCFFLFLIPSSRYIFAMQDLRLILQRISHILNEEINRTADYLGIKEKVEFYSGINFIYADPLISTGKLIHEAHKEAVMNCRVKDFMLRLINNISHEVSTPLTCIKGYTETLMDGAMEDPKTCKHFLNIINIETNRLVDLISNLLDLSFIQGGFVDMNFHISHIEKLICKAISLMKPFADSKSIKISYDKSSFKVRVDGDRIVQVIINLLDNAIRYSPKGSEIKISVKEHNEYVRTEIADCGPGITTNNLRRIFEVFERADDDRSLKKGGRGIGLAMARTIIELHGGIIGVESEPGKGSKFYFLLVRKE